MAGSQIPNQILQMRELIRELAKNSTIIVSTHVLQEVQAICERVLIMRGGKLVLDSKIDDLQSKSKILLHFQESDADVTAILRESSLVQNVEPTSNEPKTCLKLEMRKKDVPELVRALVLAGVSIESIVPEKRNLETVFAEVSTEGGASD